MHRCLFRTSWQWHKVLRVYIHVWVLELTGAYAPLACLHACPMCTESSYVANLTGTHCMKDATWNYIMCSSSLKKSWTHQHDEASVWVQQCLTKQRYGIVAAIYNFICIPMQDPGNSGSTSLATTVGMNGHQERAVGFARFTLQWPLRMFSSSSLLAALSTFDLLLCRGQTENVLLYPIWQWYWLTHSHWPHLKMMPTTIVTPDSIM